MRDWRNGPTMAALRAISLIVVTLVAVIAGAWTLSRVIEDGILQRMRALMAIHEKVHHGGERHAAP